MFRRTLIFLLAISLLAFSGCVSTYRPPENRAIIYDDQYNIKYRIEGDRVYDKDWRPVGRTEER